MSCSVLRAGCIVDDFIAQYRELLFVKIKKPVLDPLVGGNGENATIKYDTNVFLGLLENFANNPKNYVGVRVYFASYVTVPGSNIKVPDGKEQFLTIIFVPTLLTPGPDGIAQDDLDQIYSMDGSTLQHLPNPASAPAIPDVASAWINNYQLNRMPQLEQNGKAFTRNTYFRESRSLFYPMSTFKGSASAKDPGLIKYMYCLRDTPDDPTNPLDCVVLHFSALTPTDGDKYPYFQLSIVFDLHLKNDAAASNKIMVGSPSARLSRLGLVILGDGADTGLPCPPDDGCINGGSLLPMP